MFGAVRIEPSDQSFAGMVNFMLGRIRLDAQNLVEIALFDVNNHRIFQTDSPSRRRICRRIIGIAYQSHPAGEAY